MSWTEAERVVNVRENEVGEREVHAERRGEIARRGDVLVARGGLVLARLATRRAPGELLRRGPAGLRIGLPDRFRELVDIDTGARGDLDRALRRVVRGVRDELARELRADAGAGRTDVDHERAERLQGRPDALDRLRRAADHRDEPALARRVTAAGHTAVEERHAPPPRDIAELLDERDADGRDGDDDEARPRGPHPPGLLRRAHDARRL